MSDVTKILSQIEQGDPQAAEKLLPLVYDELRKLAAAKLAHEKPGQTLQATALVHEAYLRLVGEDQSPHWDSRGHFFAAAAEAMRRLLVESARRKQSLKRGDGLVRQPFDELQIAAPENRFDVLALDEALDQLAAVDGPHQRELVACQPAERHAPLSHGRDGAEQERFQVPAMVTQGELRIRPRRRSRSTERWSPRRVGRTPRRLPA